MKRNNISKIALLMSLLIINTNVKGFYQCVPKKDWFKNQFDSIMYPKYVTLAQFRLRDDRYWDLVSDNQLSGKLDKGIYRVIVAGGSGRSGGDTYEVQFSYPRGLLKKGDYSGGRGAGGEVKVGFFYLKEEQEFSACIGQSGEPGFYNDSMMGAPGGGGGAGSAFKIKYLEILVSGGGGGGGGSLGGGGGGYGCFEGGNGGEGDCNRSYGKDKCRPGKGGSVLKGNWENGKKGGDGYEDHGDNGGDGGVGVGSNGRVCANGGKGGTGYSNGQSGYSCAVNDGNDGDGYVKIYKYKML